MFDFGADTALVVMIAMFCVFGGFVIASAFYSVRLFEVQRNCARRISQMQQEKLAKEKMMRQGEIREKIYGSVPIERILGDILGDKDE